MDSTLQQTFWTWAIKRYEDTGLRERLLVLQESCGLVVVEALFCMTRAGPTADVGEALHMEEAITHKVERFATLRRASRVEQRQ